MRHHSIKFLSLLLLLVSLPAIGSWASTVKRLDIRTVLHANGTASVTEHWLISLDDSDAKTEWYVSHKGLGDMRIENLTVEGFVLGQEDLVTFETLDDWDVDASREEKTGKCGLANNGQEVCWGFGDWGEHEYIVSYELTNLVKGYDTNDGFNHVFVDMNCTVEKAVVVITGDDGIVLSEENTRRWAFGYQGLIEFDGNDIVATPEETIGNGKRMIIMLEFDKGVFQPATTASEPWADRKQRALDGSDYAKDSSSDDEDWGFWDWILMIGVIIGGLLVYFSADLFATLVVSLAWMLLCAAWWILTLSPLRKWRRRKKLGIVKGTYFRDVKKEWTLVKNKMVVDDLSYIYGMSDKNIIGALLLRLMSKGDVTIVREKYKNKDSDMLKIVHPRKEVDKEAKGDDRLASHVLKLLTLASGEDLVLQPNEFEKWCKSKSNETDIKNFMNTLEVKKDKEYIEQNAADLFGLKAFLSDFSLLNERGMMDVGLWDQYLIYAEFFGLADQVRKEMAKVWPEYMQMSNITKSLDVATEDSIVYMFSDSIYTATSNTIERIADRSSSSSGFSSFSSSGGGGGFSGGGGGGGR